MKSNKHNLPIYQNGFSLVEILVGLVIGLLATLVIMQVFSVFEGQKRTTTGSADAQTNGSIALFSIGHELQMGGFGLIASDSSALNCTTTTFGATGITSIAPVTITDGGNAAGASDSITIRYGSSSSGGIPSTISAPPSGSDVTLDTNLGCQAGDISLIVDSTGTTCALSSVDALVGTDTVTLQNITGAATSASLSCLGNWNVITFQINPNYDPVDPANSASYLERNGNAEVANIVNLQAQYGISDSANSNLVTQWVNAKDVADWNVAVDGSATGVDWGAGLTVANRNRIKAIRIAVIARNSLLEKDTLTNACSSLGDPSPTGLCAWDASAASPAVSSPAPAVTLSNDPDWERYRYRTFETIIPLRNVIWSKDALL